MGSVLYHRFKSHQLLVFEFEISFCVPWASQLLRGFFIETSSATRCQLTRLILAKSPLYPDSQNPPVVVTPVVPWIEANTALSNGLIFLTLVC